MIIRTRLTLWYAGILFLATLIIGTVAYLEIAEEKRTLRSEAVQPQGLKTGDKIEAVSDDDDHEEDEDDLLTETLAIVFWCGIPAALVGLGGGWFLMRKALAPVTALTDAASRIHEGNVRQQLPRSGNGDELDRLTEVFNQMTARLDDSFQRIREFTLHASHELKTPLTIMRGETETALRSEELPVTQRERLLSQLDEIQRLSAIVDGLTLLTKADAGQVVMSREPVSLGDLVLDAYEDAKHLALPKNIRVCLDHCDNVTVMGDRHRLRQMLLNLTDNAVKYNHPEGTVTIALRRCGEGAEITIANTGDGIPAEKRPRVFDRFYRGDESHSATREGCGLGLSIAQWIATAHMGNLRFDSEPGKWTTVVVSLPVA